MADKIYIVEGRSFRTESDRRLALRDAELIEKLRAKMSGLSVQGLKSLQNEIANGSIKFYTLLGQDFADELEQEIVKRQRLDSKPEQGKTSKRTSNKSKKTGTKKKDEYDPDIEAQAKALLAQKEKNRHRFIVGCLLVVLVSLGYFGIYSYQDYKNNSAVQIFNDIKKNSAQNADEKSEEPGEVIIHYTEDEEKILEVLPQYKDLLNLNENLIGWVKIADTKIDYPVVQYSDNEYYLTHNINKEYDKNGTIFLDADCDVVNQSTNLILYGHHMRSGAMFGTLAKYEDYSYWEKHKTIRFDSIYETGLYQVMYVFRSRLLTEEDVTFKYYQFIDANSQTEFDSYMQEMSDQSLYDTGVTAEYGDHLLTLSTCDYQESNGRFVVVAKKVE